MVAPIQYGQTDAWLHNKLIERQATPSYKESEQSQAGQNIQEAQSASSQAPPLGGQQQIPWMDLMDTLGLELTGSSVSDMEAIYERLQIMQAQATDDAEKLQVQDLIEEYEGYKSVASNMATPAAQMLGATQLGEINKYQLLGIT